MSQCRKSSIAHQVEALQGIQKHVHDHEIKLIACLNSFFHFAQKKCIFLAILPRKWAKNKSALFRIRPLALITVKCLEKEKVQFFKMNMGAFFGKFGFGYIWVIYGPKSTNLMAKNWAYL